MWMEGWVRKKHFLFIIDDVNECLKEWKCRFFFKVGCVALATSVILAILSYEMHIYKLSSYINAWIDHLIRISI